MMGRMSLREYREWQAFSNIHGIGPAQVDLQVARILAAIMNALTKRKDGKAFSPVDFLLHKEEDSAGKVISSLKEL
jgi:hypothetical protein